VGFGGAGPLHANALGILTQAWPVIVPPGPGVLCAYGDATTQVQDEAARTYLTMAEELSNEQLLADLHELRQRAGESLVADGIPADSTRSPTRPICAMRARRFQITVDFTEEELLERGIALLTEQFDAEHEQLFTFKLGDGHEILMIRAVARAAAREVADAHDRRGGCGARGLPGARQPFLLRRQLARGAHLPAGTPALWLGGSRPLHRAEDGLDDRGAARLRGTRRQRRQPADQSRQPTEGQ
jgi:N-methylhydantoinase A/oxoprolinase/acetone carboxylase beta subunit